MNPKSPLRQSGHYWTRARIAAAALAKQAAGELTAAQHLWTRLEVRDHTPVYNQRQRRKNRRRAYAAGNRFAFA